MTLNKSTHLLSRRQPGPRMVWFAPDDGPVPTVAVERQAYEDMGEPAEVTITIEPGDHLNNPPDPVR